MAPSRLLEAHYCNLVSQSNIYGLTKFVMPCGTNKILVASLQGRVISLEFQKTKPLSREVHFTYIPGDAEIVSIDSFGTKRHDPGIKVGISFTKHVEENLYHYLNIYSECEKEANCDLDKIAQGCQTLDLNFVPYKLYHTELLTTEGPETVFLLSGGDQAIHLYRVEDTSLETLHFAEDVTETYFPEFSDLPSCVTCIHCEYLEGSTTRLTLLGCIDGTIRVSLVSTENCEIVKQWEIQHDSPICSVKFFKLLTDVLVPSFISQVFDGEEEPILEYPEYNILVTSALEAAVVYRNVLEQGFSLPLILPESDNFDSVLCSHVADIDFDGQNEVLLGCYGQKLLVYKFYPKHLLSAKSTPERSSSQPPPPPLQQHQSSLTSKSDTNCFTPTKPESNPYKTPSKSHPNTPLLKQDMGTPKMDRSGHAGSQKSESSVGGTPVKLPQATPSTPVSVHSVHQSHSTPLLGKSADSTVDNVTHDLDNTSIGGISTNSLLEGEFRLQWQRTFPDPVLALDEMDITGDGLNEIIVVSLKGVHVLQHNISEVAKICMQRLQMAQVQQDLNTEEDAFQLLLTENITVSERETPEETATEP